mmetsp:Transcript_9036/g.21498  ORF Transcript_9036/g.21498 Transcript_9036/m.21498 type:complete len:221 (+) Transcript_9036:979-1641(+)
MMLYFASLEKKGAVRFIQKLFQVFNHLFDYGQVDLLSLLPFCYLLFFLFLGNLFGTSQGISVNRIEFLEGLICIGRSQKILLNIRVHCVLTFGDTVKNSIHILKCNQATNSFSCGISSWFRPYACSILVHNYSSMTQNGLPRSMVRRLGPHAPFFNACLAGKNSNSRTNVSDSRFVAKFAAFAIDEPQETKRGRDMHGLYGQKLVQIFHGLLGVTIIDEC